MSVELIRAMNEGAAFRLARSQPAPRPAMIHEEALAQRRAQIDAERRAALAAENDAHETAIFGGPVSHHPMIEKMKARNR